MFNPDFVLLYVNSPEASAVFYQKILGIAPVELSATFALFKSESGLKLGLWAKNTVEPAALACGGGAELAFALNDVAAVDDLYARWSVLTIIQKPVQMDFGYTFVATDPDQHRLRVYALNAG
ncbi:extradiol dioxygenase [Iodobacter sp. HSC-16F04]|uniref:Extradiol dioxygenase n=1 Tax=Iodobacter violaceini TaxID=3044271 RepID=A0ABX0KT56_9NEIS|nr:VOC family protein [Iodobacter violacea]NHQ85279.1 extradiol dioxygenase [Iodobacter violacea]